jgi:hypothetical protein
MSVEKQTTVSFTVVEKHSKKTFRSESGTLTSADLNPYQVMPEPSGTNPEEDGFEMQVYREGILFDSGKIVYVSGHDGSHHFSGLREIGKGAARDPRSEEMIVDNLRAEWFELGDELIVFSA